MNCDSIIRNKINELLWNINKTKDFETLKNIILICLEGTKFESDIKTSKTKNEIKSIVRSYFYSLSNYDVFVREISKFEEMILPENEAYSAYKYFLSIISKVDDGGDKPSFIYNKDNKFINDYVCQIRTEYLNPQYTVWTEGFKTVAPDLIVDYIENYYSYIDLTNYLNSEVNKPWVDESVVLDSKKLKNYMDLVLKIRVFGIEHFQVCYYSSINNNGLLMDETKRYLNSNKKFISSNKLYDVFTSAYYAYKNHLDSFSTYESNIREFIKVNPFDYDGLYFFIEMSDVDIVYRKNKNDKLPIYLTEEFVEILKSLGSDKIEKLNGFMCLSADKSTAFMHDMDYILNNYIRKGDYKIKYTGPVNKLKSIKLLSLEDYKNLY